MQLTTTIKKTGAFMMLLLAMSCSDDFKSPVTPSGATLVDKVAASSDLDIFKALLIKAGLDANLENINSGVYTLFAPTDDAFLTFFSSASIYNKTLTEEQALDTISYMTNIKPSGTWNIALLIARLNYHLIGSEVMTSSIGGGKTFITFNGARLSLSSQGSNVLLNGNVGSSGAKVVTADTEASNGVLHTIDKVMAATTTANTVLTPFNGMSVSYGATTVVNGGTEAGADTNGADFDLFAFAIRTGNMATILVPNTSPLPDFTIFAPTDAVMMTYFSAATEADAVTAIKALTADEVSNLVKYHIANGRLLSTDLSDNLTISTLLTSKILTVTLNGSDIMLKDAMGNNALITSANSIQNNGVVHTINTVLQAN